MNNKIVLLTKDAFLKGYLPIYGNKYWKTPNIDQLAKKGTIFDKHYTAAPSTAMSFSSMFTGKYAYQFDRKLYSKLNKEYEDNTLFDILSEKGYENHIIWSPNYMTKALPYAKTFGEPRTKFHILDINQPVGPHLENVSTLERNLNLEKNTKNLIFNEIDEIYKNTDKLFLWIHLPHVLLGRISYGDDVDIFDEIVGKLRKVFGDDSIYISSDHGHMNGVRNKFGYGFDLDETAINIPLISPRINNFSRYNKLSSNCDLIDIIVNKKIPTHKYIVSETAYYCQLHRKMTIVTERYKYIFDGKNQKESFYDLSWDKEEKVNLIYKNTFDVDRGRKYNINELFFYPFWNSVQKNLILLRELKNSFWKNCYNNKFEKMKWKLSYYIKKFLLKIYNSIMLKKKRVRK